MIAVDTNILVRFLVADDQVQAEKVHAFFKDLEHRGERCFVSSAVVLELLWVLESSYDFGREEIAQALDAVTNLSVLKLEDEAAIRAVREDVKTTRQGLADLFIAHLAQRHKCEYVVTFDKQASKHPLFRLMD